MSSLKTRRSKCIAAVMACALTLTSMAGTEVQAAKKAKAKLAKTKLTVKVGKTVTIKLKKKLKKAKYTYVSKNKKIATVSKKGKVKGVRKGSAKITVTEKVGKKKYNVGTVKVTVTKKGSTTTTANPTVNPAASAPAASLVPSAPAATAPSSGTVTNAPASSEPTSGVSTSKPTSPSKATKKPPATKAPTPTPIIKPSPIVEEESKVETYAVDFRADVKLEVAEENQVIPTVETGSTISILKAKFDGGYKGFHMFVPDTDDMKTAKFKYVTITYKNTDADLSLYLYDETVDLANPDLTQQATGKHNRKIGLEKTGDTFKTITITVADQYEKDFDFTKSSFRGLQIFGFEAKTDLTIRSVVFNAKEPKSSFDMSTIPEVEGVVYDEASGELQVADGVEMFRVPLPADIIGEGENIVKVPKDKMVSVTIKGRLSEESTGFRFWLCEGDPDATASDQYHFTKTNGVGFGGAGDGDVEFNTGEFTVKAILLCGGIGSKNFAADSLTIKAPIWGEKMNGVTITSIEARMIES